MDFKRFLLSYSDWRARFAKYSSGPRAGEPKALVVEWRFVLPAPIFPEVDALVTANFPAAFNIYRSVPTDSSPSGLGSLTISRVADLNGIKRSLTKETAQDGSCILKTHPRWPIFRAWCACVDVLPSNMQDRYTHKYEGSRQDRRALQLEAVKALYAATEAGGGANRLIELPKVGA